MVNIDLKDNSVLVSLDGKYSKIMTEIFIALVKLTGDNPGTLNTTLEFLKVLENDLKDGLDIDIIINSLMSSYYKIGGKNNGWLFDCWRIR